MTKDDKVEMISRIESSKTDTIKWMFIFWIGQLALWLESYLPP
jgi:hypothetical protein